MENDRPVSFLPICGKVFQRFIYNSLFEISIENNLIPSDQSGFEPGESCTDLSITHEIYKPLDDGYEVRDVFLDISKTLDKIEQNGLIYKLNKTEQVVIYLV